MVIAYDDSDGWYDHQIGPIVNSSRPLRTRLPAPAPAAAAPTALPGVSSGHAHAQGRCGYGPRLPLLVISPWARQNFVDHTITDQSSIIRFHRGQLARRQAHWPRVVRHDRELDRPDVRLQPASRRNAGSYPRSEHRRGRRRPSDRIRQAAIADSWSIANGKAAAVDPLLPCRLIRPLALPVLCRLISRCMISDSRDEGVRVSSPKNSF